MRVTILGSIILYAIISWVQIMYPRLLPNMAWPTWEVSGVFSFLFLMVKYLFASVLIAGITFIPYTIFSKLAESTLWNATYAWVLVVLSITKTLLAATFELSSNFTFEPWYMYVICIGEIAWFVVLAVGTALDRKWVRRLSPKE